jgi:hypothetical protein
MTRFAPIALLLALSGCATTSQYLNCENARVTAQAALDAVNYACPVPEDTTAVPAEGE